jgi:hypothetical protein
MTRLPRRESPFLTTRRLVTVALLCTSLVIVVVAQRSFSRPAAWRWVTGQGEAPPVVPISEHNELPQQHRNMALVAAATRAGLAVGQASYPFPSPGEATGGQWVSAACEYVPLAPIQPVTNRRAPYPDSKLLAGAADGDRFLAPPDDALPELRASAKATGDARARYHLFQLAQDATPGSLEADSRRDVRYEALRQKPESYRGELITIQGDLVSLGEPMELKGKLPGLDVCYLGLLVGAKPEYRYLILFTDLPPALNENRKEWGQLYIPNVQFSGYFYKVAKFLQSTGQRREWSLPVLVGKAPLLPSRVEDNNWSHILLVFAAMAAPVVLIAAFLPKLFRRDEARHSRLMEKIRARHDERVHQDLDPPAEPPAPPPMTATDNDKINRLREGLSPTEWN